MKAAKKLTRRSEKQAMLNDTVRRFEALPSLSVQGRSQSKGKSMKVEAKFPVKKSCIPHPRCLSSVSSADRSLRHRYATQSSRTYSRRDTRNTDRKHILGKIKPVQVRVYSTKWKKKQQPSSNSSSSGSRKTIKAATSASRR